MERFSPLTPPPWAMCKLLGWSIGSSPDSARNSHPACPLSLILSSRVRFQSQGCSLSSSLHGSQGRTHGTPRRGDEAAPSMLHLPARQNSMHIALPRPAVFKDWGTSCPAYVLYVPSLSRGMWQETSNHRDICASPTHDQRYPMLGAAEARHCTV